MYRLSEEDYGRISNLIEKRLEGLVDWISEKYEECELIDDLYFPDPEEQYGLTIDNELGVWKYDSDEKISKIAKSVEETPFKEKINEILFRDDLFYGSKNTLLQEFLSEKERINNNYGCNIKDFGDNDFWSSENEWIYTDAFILADELLKRIKNDKVCKDISLSDIEKVAPLTANIIQHHKEVYKAKEKIRDIIKKTGRLNECKNLPKIDIDDYPIVTPDNPDLSYASNPFITDFYSEELKKRIKEAEKIVNFDF